MTRWGVLGAVLVWSAFGLVARGGTAEEDWREIAALDAGPQRPMESTAAAREQVRQHLARQERSLRAFLSRHPADAHQFEARLRLARLLEIRGDLEDSAAPREESGRILDQLGKAASPAQQSELDFAKIARQMRGMRQPGDSERAALLAAARAFQNAHPTDRRLAALLTEVAELFEEQPRTMEALLQDAGRLTSDEALRARIADDLKRVRLLGAPLVLPFQPIQGRAVTLASLRGQPVLILFFATFSPPSTVALATLQKAVAGLPAGSVQVLGISLDPQRAPLEAWLKARGVVWPVACDGQGWESPLIRGLGINALPTVWLLDASGRVRSLRALEGTAEKVRALLPPP